MNTTVTRRLVAPLAVALLVGVVCALLAVPQAAHAQTFKRTLLAPPQGASATVKAQFAEPIVSYRSKIKMKKARSTNKAIAVLKVKKKALQVVPKAAGKATLTCKVGKKSIKVKVTVVEFSEPFSQFKIGSTDLTAKLNGCGKNVDAGVHTLSGKVLIDMANGWKLDWCSYFKKKFTTVKAGKSCKLVGKGVMSISVSKGKLTRFIDVRVQ